MTPSVGFVLEQTLGHVTHSDNLRRLVPNHNDVDATFIPVDFAVTGWHAHVPAFGNWTIRAGVRARRGIRSARRQRGFDALFIHTQVPAVLLPDVLRRTPTVVSLDATPLQYDELGEHYAHATAGRRVERLKWKANQACFRRAAHLVTWSQWTKDALVDGYDIDADHITVIPPGVNPEQWTPEPRPPVDAGSPVVILFVGGDLRRKGGHHLLEAFRALRDDNSLPPVELHLVTAHDPPSEPGLVVHHGLRPNSRELIELYHRSDIFCLPTLGDCLPMVLSEAGAARLPVVATSVGAIPEIVSDGDSGFLVAPGDVRALTRRLRDLVADGDLRRQFGGRAAEVVRERFNADANTAKLVELLARIGGGELR